MFQSLGYHYKYTLGHHLINDVINGNCAAGMSTLFRKDVLDEHGGLKKFSVYLAEDFFIAQVFQDW